MRVTIGLPFYNCATTLATTIRSIFAQQYQDWELLLIDDGSTDGSLEIARAVNDPRVRVVHDGLNRRTSFRANELTELARGELLARMDGDDLMHPARLARQVAVFDAHPEVDVLGTGICAIDEQHTPLGTGYLQPIDPHPATVLRRGLFAQPTIMGQTAWFRRHAYDGAYVRSEDFELWCRTCRLGNFAHLPEPLLFYRVSLDGSIDNYLYTLQTNCAIYRRYGPQYVGWPTTAMLIAGSLAKAALYRTYARFDAHGVWIRRRYTPLNDVDAVQARDTLARILTTPVPGFPDAGDDGGNAIAKREEQ
jgi:glycosyltransferase involved in cell wall biosynthesis